MKHDCSQAWHYQLVINEKINEQWLHLIINGLTLDLVSKRSDMYSSRLDWFSCKCLIAIHSSQTQRCVWSTVLQFSVTLRWKHHDHTHISNTSLPLTDVHWDDDLSIIYRMVSLKVHNLSITEVLCPCGSLEKSTMH